MFILCRYLSSIYMKPYLTGVDCATDVATVYVFLSHDNDVLHKLGYFSMAVILLHKVTLNICTIHIYRYIYMAAFRHPQTFCAQHYIQIMCFFSILTIFVKSYIYPCVFVIYIFVLYCPKYQSLI